MDASQSILQTLTAMRSHLPSYFTYTLTVTALLGFSTVRVRSADVLSSSEGVYNSSQTPADLPWNTYNYCNAPHVNAKHYTAPSVDGAKLVYLNLVMRHHKV